MVVSRVQKKGRITGEYPMDDARIIDQFMDEVIQAVVAGGDFHAGHTAGCQLKRFHDGPEELLMGNKSQ